VKNSVTRLLIETIACAGIVLCGTALSRAFAQEVPAYLNTNLPAEQRAADLVHRLTLEEKASQLTNYSRAIPRLKVPSYDWWSEALHGVATNGITEFPEPIGLGATFDPDAIHLMGSSV
jgi:beta-glucosidase